MRRCLCVVLLMGFVIASGCSKGPTLVTVTGRVTLDGNALPHMMVNFTPVGDTQGNGGIAATDDEGRFTLMSVRSEAGILVGDYKVSFYPANPPPTKKDDPADVVASPKRGNVPPAFLNANDSPLRVTIPDSGGFVAIRLTKSGEGSTAKFEPKE